MHFYSFWLHFSLPRNLGQEELILKLSMWHETKQNKPGQFSQHKKQQAVVSVYWVWPVGLIAFFLFFEDASTAWITMIPSTCDNFQSCLNSGEPDFSFISFWWLAIKKNLSVSTFDIALVCLGGAADAIETEHSCHSTHCYFTDGTIQFAV